MNQSSSTEKVATAGLRLATAPVNWNNNDIPAWRPVTPFPDILDRMREAGYSATEYDDSFGTDVEILNNESSLRGITWTGCYQWVDFLDSASIDDSIDALIPKLELLRAIGCSHLIVADSLRPNRVALAGRVPSDGSESLADDDVATIAANVHRLADAAAGFGIVVHYHNHVGSWIEAPHELEALLQHLDTSRVDLCFDTGHYAYGGGDAASFIRKYLDAIGYLHLKDVDTDAVARARAEKLTFIEALKQIVFSPIGQGAADIPEILATLVSSSFTGWVVIEQDTCDGDSTQVAQNNLSFINTWLTGRIESSAIRR
jgi:inosose dehydratase